MLEHLKENTQIYIIFLFWLVIGMYGGPVIYAVIPGVMILMWRKGFFEELFWGFFFILFLSDSLEDKLFFAKNAKNIYIVFLALFFFSDLKNFQSANKLYKLFLPFFIFSFITVLLSVNEKFFFTSLEKTLSYFLVFLIVPNITWNLYIEKGPAFFRNFILFISITLISGILFKYVSYDLTHIKGDRYRGLLGNPNGMGIYCTLFFILFFIVNDFFPNLFSKSERILIYVVILYSMILCGSRNAFVALLIFIIYQRFFRISSLLGTIVFLFTILAVELISANFDAIIISLGLGKFFRIRTLSDGSGRYIAWEFAWKQIQKNFFIGKGFGYNEYYMRQYYGLLGKLGHQGGIHNSFLTFWMDQGLIGLLIYLRSFILTFIKASRNTKFALPAMFAISFSALFESWLVGSLSVFAFLALMIFTIITSEEISDPGSMVQKIS